MFTNRFITFILTVFHNKTLLLYSTSWTYWAHLQSMLYWIWIYDQYTLGDFFLLRINLIAFYLCIQCLTNIVDLFVIVYVEYEQVNALFPVWTSYSISLIYTCMTLKLVVLLPNFLWSVIEDRHASTIFVHMSWDLFFYVYIILNLRFILQMKKIRTLTWMDHCYGFFMSILLQALVVFFFSIHI